MRNRTILSVVVTIVSLSICFMGSGCCTVMSGSTQEIPVSSEPSGAKVVADNGTTITTPGRVILRREKAHTLVAKYPGYEPLQQKLSKNLNNWIFLDPLIDFGIFTIPIDFMTGSVDELKPKQVHFNFGSKMNPEAN